MFFIYRLLYSLVLVILLPFEYLKRPKSLRSRWLKERLGFVKPLSLTMSRSLWVHAVSVGEVISAVPFITELKLKYPSLQIVLSTVTDTGQQVARDRVSGMADIVYLPFDLTSVIERFVKNIRPGVFIAIETELWPEIFHVLKKKGIPILVFNGRLSEGSFKGYRKIRFFIKGVLECVDLFCMQERVYGERIRALGVNEDRIRVIGNFKFDIKPPDLIPEWSGFLAQPVVLAGSTHEGEEELMISVFEGLRREFPDMNLVVAPRHPERFVKVEGMMKAKGVDYLKRSELKAVSVEQGTIKGRVVLLDTIGELASAYGMSEIAVIGGSFADHGGHNPLEPAFWGKPILCGPHMENFPFVQEFYRTGAARKTDAQGLYDLLRELIRSPAQRSVMGERAQKIYSEKAGAVARSVEVLEGYIEKHLPFPEEQSLS
jgi:3-deoxy-D-manno-octulosonic-acid transferase